MKAIACLVLFASLSGAASQQELRFALHSDPKTFDPLHVEDAASEAVRYVTAGVLVRVNRATDQVLPELAESWKIIEGGRAVAFHLRAGLKFSDGTPLTSADVARTVERALDPKENSPAGDSLRTGQAVPEVKVAGPLDITIRYAAPKPGIDRLFDGIGIGPTGNAKLPATAGPYFVAEFHPGTFLLLKRNPNYWKHDPAGHQLPYIDAIRIDIQQNRDIELTRFLRGELHLIPKIDPDSFDRVAKEKPGWGKSAGASLDSEFLWFNLAPAKSIPEWKKKWFQSTAFRHAVSQAIHREDIVALDYKGHAHPAAGPISTANKSWFNPELKPLAANPARAAKLLAGDGFQLRDGVLRDRDGHVVEFSLITNAGHRPREKAAALIQNDLKKVGIQVNIVTLDMGSLLERIRKSLDYEAALLGLNLEADPMELMNIWLSSGPEHSWWPSEKTPATPWEARIDALMMEQASSTSMAVRKKAVAEFQRIAVAEEPMIFLVNPDFLAAVSPVVKGLQLSVAPPQVLWNVEWLKLE